MCFLDIESGAREAKNVEPLTYDWVWHGGTAANTEMKILVQKSGAAYATTLVSGLKGVGIHDWEPDDKGQVTVTLRTYVDGYYLDTLDETAVFNVAERVPLAVTRFTAAPRYPWNGKVDIDLTFTGENREYAVTLVAKDLVGGTNLVVRTVSGATASGEATSSSLQNKVGSSLTSGEDAASPLNVASPLLLRPGAYRLTWDADADIAGDADFERVSISVRVEEK